MGRVWGLEVKTLLFPMRQLGLVWAPWGLQLAAHTQPSRQQVMLKYLGPCHPLLALTSPGPGYCGHWGVGLWDKSPLCVSPSFCLSHKLIKVPSEIVLEEWRQRMQQNRQS